MVEPIDKVKAAARAAQRATNSGSSGSHSSGFLSVNDSGPGPISRPVLQENRNIIAEEDESAAPKRPQWLQSQSSQHFAASSPGQLTPHGEDSEEDELAMLRREREHKTESPRPVGMGSIDHKSTASAPAATHSVPNPGHHQVKSEPGFFDIPVPQASREGEAKKQEALGGSSRAQNQDQYGVLRKDTVLSPGEKAERQGPLAEQQEEFSPEDWGLSFKIEWIRVGTLPFHRLRSLRNPWNADREVKVSRDGTEVEPGKQNICHGRIPS